MENGLHMGLDNGLFHGNYNGLTSPASNFKQGYRGSKCVFFDGVDAEGRFADSSFDTLNNGTISFWLRMNSVTAQPVPFYCSINASTDYCGIQIPTNRKLKIISRVGGANKYVMNVNSTSILDNKWYHIAWSKQGSIHAVYINGIPQVLTFTVTTDLTGYFSSISAGTRRYTLGAYRGPTTGSYLTGYMSNFSLWNRGLLFHEVQKLYNNGRPGSLLLPFSQSLLAWIKMGDDDVYPTLKDSKGTYNVTMINMLSTDIIGRHPLLNT